MTIDPGHFHAALVQKEMYSEVASRAHVFAPLGPDLIEHLARVAGYNRRAERPTTWELDAHASADFFERMLRERPGDVVVLSGRNRVKIDRIAASIGAGLHVLADKPWILKSEDFPKLEGTLEDADRRGVVAYDIMTERFEITSLLQRALVNDPATFGAIVPGTQADPAVYMESVHYLMKTVSGAPNIRPPWFFDTGEQGEGLSDVGTHLVDLVQWTLFPDAAIDYRSDIRILAARRWPTTISRQEFQRVTREPRFPDSLAAAVKGDSLEYDCNTLVTYALRGVHVTLNVIWDWEPPPESGDTHFAYYRGTRARVEVRQGAADRFRAELYVIPAYGVDRAELRRALDAKIASLQDLYPGLGVEDRGAEFHIAIPDRLRVGHEAHFAQVTANFLGYLRNRAALPAWERPNMLAKYYVTTRGTEMSRETTSAPAPRIAP
jgi:predicted dehydrogenase